MYSSNFFEVQILCLFCYTCLTSLLPSSSREWQLLKKTLNIYFVSILLLMQSTLWMWASYVLNECCKQTHSQLPMCLHSRESELSSTLRIPGPLIIQVEGSGGYHLPSLSMHRSDQNAQSSTWLGWESETPGCGVHHNYISSVMKTQLASFSCHP